MDYKKRRVLAYGKIWMEVWKEKISRQANPLTCCTELFGLLVSLSTRSKFRYRIMVLFYTNLASINDVQSLLQGTELLTLKVVDKFILYYLFIIT